MTRLQLHAGVVHLPQPRSWISQQYRTTCWNAKINIKYQSVRDSISCQNDIHCIIRFALSGSALMVWAFNLVRAEINCCVLYNVISIFKGSDCNIITTISYTYLRLSKMWAPNKIYFLSNKSLCRHFLMIDYIAPLPSSISREIIIVISFCNMRQNLLYRTCKPGSFFLSFTFSKIAYARTYLIQF